MAFMEYVVLNSALGDLEMDRCSPFGTVKSRIANLRGHEQNRSIGKKHTIRGTCQVAEEVVLVPSCDFIVGTEDI
jgi:hypothetical protein